MSRCAGALLLSMLALQSQSIPAADFPQYVAFRDERLAFGRTVWLGTCEGCHGYGIAGAPVPMQPQDWQERISRDRETLYDRAINGFFGPDDTYMPERGGNTGLNDDEVRAAVDYMVALATFYIEKTGETK